MYLNVSRFSISLGCSFVCIKILQLPFATGFSVLFIQISLEVWPVGRVTVGGEMVVAPMAMVFSVRNEGHVGIVEVGIGGVW